jgi:hypothetical protein
LVGTGATMSRRTLVYVGALLVVVAALGVVIGRQTNPTSTITTSTTTLIAQPATAVWPFATSLLRFTDPSTAAYSFAVDYLGFTQPIIGAFQRGDTRSGEVPIRAASNGPVTTVMVRQLTSDNTWWILGAASASISVTAPMALASVSSPLALSGRSSAFEAVVNVDLRQDNSLVSVVRTTVMGGSMGVMEPFAKSVTFSAPLESAGALVLRTFSAKDGSVVQASVVRVTFAH